MGLTRMVGEIQATDRHRHSANELAPVANACQRVLCCDVVTVHVARGRPPAVAAYALLSGQRQLRILRSIYNLEAPDVSINFLVCLFNSFWVYNSI
jgi:hypothetical protein